MKQKLIMRSDALPQHIQVELASMQAAIEQKYGTAAHMMGTMLENLANVCNMVRAENLTTEQRAAAYERSQEACADVLNVMARILNVNRSAVMSIVEAYRDFTTRVEEELLGTEEVLSGTESEAAAVIAKAKLH